MTKKTEFNLYNVTDVNMMFNNAGLYVSEFHFDHIKGYTYKVTEDESKEAFRFDYAALQDILDSRIMQAKTGTHGFVFTLTEPIMKPESFIINWNKVIKDEELDNLVFDHLVGNTFILY